jgi:hypothetical protein
MAMERNTDYVAVIGNGSWGGNGAVHAADPTAGGESKPGDVRFSSLCGLHLLFRVPTTSRRDGSWGNLPAYERKCKRCLKVLEED